MSNTRLAAVNALTPMPDIAQLKPKARPLDVYASHIMGLSVPQICIFCGKISIILLFDNVVYIWERIVCVLNM